MNEEKKIVQLDTSQTEDRLRKAMPVLSASETLSPENVARALSGAKKVRRIPLTKYVGAAVAAVLILAIGIGAAGGGFFSKKAEMDSDAYAMSPKETMNGAEDTAPSPAFEDGTLSPASDGLLAFEVDGVTYVACLGEAVAFDAESEERYLGNPVRYATEEIFPSGNSPKAYETEGAQGPVFYAPVFGETDADLCAVVTLGDGSRVILFLYEPAYRN